MGRGSGFGGREMGTSYFGCSSSSSRGGVIG